MEEKEDIHLGHWMIYRVRPLNAFIMAGDADQALIMYPRVSSTIQKFDLETMTATTERGRRYFLHGSGGEGLHLHTYGTLNQWLHIHGYTEDQIEKASPEDVDVALNSKGPQP